MNISNSQIKEKERCSNIELLRLFCMWSIVMYHIIEHSIIQICNEVWFYESLMSLFHFGVPVFVLISGWFGLNLSWKRIIYVYIPFSFYTIFLNVLFFGFDFWTQGNLTNLLLLKDGTNMWFIQAYIYLCIITPILNCAIENSSNKQLLYFTFLLSVFVYIYGFCLENQISKGGKSIISFVFFYFVGRFLRKYLHSHTIHINGKILFYSLFFISIVIFVLKYYNVFPFCKITKLFYSYDSPGLLLISILIFLLFTSFQYQSKVINYLAKNSFAIYLIPCTTCVASLIYKGSTSLYSLSNNGLLSLVILFLFSLVICVASIFLDKILCSLFLARFQILLVSISEKFTSIVKSYHMYIKNKILLYENRNNS